MTIYGISGLGADERVFKFLSISQKIEPIRWIKPNPMESISDYASRLSAQIIDKDFMLIGVSFGGLIAVEITKFLKPKLTILVSSAEKTKDLRIVYRWIGKVGLMKWIPSFFFKPPNKIMFWLFGALNKKLLSEILNDTDLKFSKWALIQLCSWDNHKEIPGLIKIHGSKDKLIPPGNSENVITIEDGAHFMIVDKAKEIINIIEEKIGVLNLSINFKNK